MAGRTWRVGFPAVAVVLALVLWADMIEGAKRRQPRARRAIEPNTGPTEDLIWDSGLMEKDMSYANIVERGREYYSDTRARRFGGFVLGYVTPWNKAGYSNAVTFRHKLDAVSPVWFQIKQKKGEDRPVIEGGHEVNETWIAELKQGGSGPLVVPRFIIEAEPEEHVQLLTNGRALLEELGTLVLASSFDGMVLEAWTGWQMINGLANEQFRSLVMNLIRTLGTMMRDSGKKLYLAVPPPYPQTERAPWLDRKDMIELMDYVDGLSVMTYDYSTNAGQAGPNSPMSWIRNNLKLAKEGSGEGDQPVPQGALAGFLMGLNFYGWDFSARGGAAAVTADGLLQLLQKHEPAITWHDAAEEHVFQYTDKSGSDHQVWYPTPRSMEMRLQAARAAGVGVSIWELGQGLERFFDLL